ncbi:MAG TPA: carboxypeptidase-like regulatory domain-containing protein [Candidatus Angelobacter sp.]|jgi:5-hydroxyisourate hydrolase-like protein (transthyretin family)|nr:carboxypeptidase-like regulatory domain-containing protein [Candidatus Angelobacter sp.]
MAILAILAILAGTITGTVRNQTTGHPAAGDTVVLLKVGEGNQENPEAQTKTDVQGSFTFTESDAKGVYVVRVLHQGVSYDRNVTGANPLEVRVFDAVPKIAGLSGNIGMAQIEPDKKQLKVTEMYSITNSSSPPITQAGGANVAISLPATAVLDWLQVRDEAGNWSNRSALPVKGQKGHYAANVPFRPGETFYKLSYHLPYRGPTSFHIVPGYPIRNFAVGIPPSMSLKPSRPGTFREPGHGNGFNIYPTIQPVVKGVPVFVVSTAASAAPPGETPNVMPPAEAAPPPLPSHPAPAASPDQVQQQSKQAFWPILSLIIIVLGAGIFGLWRMRRNATRAVRPHPKITGPLPLLAALKEELFRLENDRLQGSISAEEYETAKAALNQTLQRAMEKK